MRQSKQVGYYRQAKQEGCGISISHIEPFKGWIFKNSKNLLKASLALKNSRCILFLLLFFLLLHFPHLSCNELILKQVRLSEIPESIWAIFSLLNTVLKYTKFSSLITSLKKRGLLNGKQRKKVKGKDIKKWSVG